MKGTPLPGVSIRCVGLPDSVFIFSATTDRNGFFKQSSFLEGNANGILLTLSYIGMKPHEQHVKAPTNLTGSGQPILDADMDTIWMEPQPITMREALIVEKLRKMYMSGDTVLFRTDAYEMPKGSMLLDLVRRLPGLDCSEDGKLTYLGKSIDELRLNGKEFFRMDGTYNGSSLAYTLTANGESKSGNIGLNSPYYDNNEFHQSLRGISTFGTSFSFSFNTAVVNASEQTSISLTLSVNGTETVSDLPFPSVSKDGDGNEVQNQTTALNCYRTTLSRSTTVTGAAQTLYYTVDPVYAAINEEGTDTLIGTSYDDSKWQLPHVLVRIVEPYNDADRNPQKVTYTLKEISLIP